MMLEQLTSTSCLGVVLAGGLSSRMGTDKAKLIRQDKDMLAFSIGQLKSTGITDVIVSGNGYDVADEYAQAGPLGGIYSVLKKYQPKAILALPVDLPLLSTSLLTELLSKGQLANKACCFEQHALPIYLPNNAYTELFFQQAFSNFNGKGPSARSLLKQVPSVQLPLTSTQQLLNTNTPQEWQQAQQVLIGQNVKRTKEQRN